MDLRTRMFKDFAITLFFLFILNTLASYFDWYESFIGFDKIAHFTGGIVGSFFLAWLLNHKYITLFKEKKIRKIILLNTLLFICAALLWEVMEYSVQGFFSLGHLLASPWDSVGDLAAGTLGSFVGLYYFFGKLKTWKLKN